jgi:hypothetical protein
LIGNSCNLIVNKSSAVKRARQADQRGFDVSDFRLHHTNSGFLD